MRSEFGPWTTHIGPGPVEGLSGFWTRRILRLPDLTAAPANPSRRQVLQLSALGLGLAALPTLRPGVAQEAVKPAKAAEPRGEIFVLAQFRDKTKESQYVSKLISVDPRTGEHRDVGPLKSGIVSVSRDGKRLASGDFEVKEGYGRLKNVVVSYAD